MRAGAFGRSPALVLLAVCVLAVSACGGDDSESSTAEQDGEAAALGEVRVGSVAQLAQCSDWERGSREERLATIDDIREQINLRDGTVQTPELSDDAAYEVFESTCSQDFAKSFRLYKVYARAAGFASFSD